MSVNKDLTRLSRLTNILIMLQSKRVITAVEMGRKFDVSVRTIYRDIRALEDSGVPIFTVEGKGYSLMEGYNLSPVMFTEQEANALITAAKFIEQNKDSSLVKSHEDAITKVKAVLRYAGKDKAELLTNRMVYIKNLQKDVTSNSLSKIQVAITNMHLVTIKYESIGKRELTRRSVEPMALYHTRENWIMISWCRLRKAFREFRLDGIQNIVVENELFENRAFDLMKYFNSGYK